MQERLGVLLFNLGGPEKLDDVRPFLFNLFSDPDIIQAALAHPAKAARMGHLDRPP